MMSSPLSKIKSYITPGFMGKAISEERVFYPDSEKVLLIDGQNQTLKAYQSAREQLWIEEDLKLSQISKVLEMEPTYLNWNKIFQASEGKAKLEEKMKAVPGLLIRYGDDVDFFEKYDIPKEDSINPYLEDIVKVAHLGNFIWSQADFDEMMSLDTFDFKVYYAFSSRTYFPIDAYLFKENPEETELGAEVKRLFFEFLAKEDGLIFDILTPDGYVAHKPDSNLLKNALDSGVKVAISQYKLTNMAATNYVYDSLKDSVGAVRQQFEQMNSLFEKRTDMMSSLVPGPDEDMDEFLDILGDLMEPFDDDYGRLEPLIDLKDTVLDFLEFTCYRPLRDSLKQRLYNISDAFKRL